MIVLEISLLMTGLWLHHIDRFFLGACLSKNSVQIVENASSSFSFKNLDNFPRGAFYSTPTPPHPETPVFSVKEALR